MPQANPSGGANSERLENVTFPQARIDINDNLEALQTLNSGNSEPSTKAAFMQWLDTSSDPAVLKIRNAANTSWIEVGSLSATEYASKGLTAIANGGTGQTTAAAAAAALLPDQSGNSGKSLITDGSILSWATLAATSHTRFDYTGSSQTWTKPSLGTVVIIFAWGGGGGGSRSYLSEGGGGGGGGACAFFVAPLSTLSETSYTVTIGNGGSGGSGGSYSSGNNGGNTSVGSLLTAHGGQKGTCTSSSDQTAGAGGGFWGTGSENLGGRAAYRSAIQGDDSISGWNYYGAGSEYFGGGGGGVWNQSASKHGGKSFFGGGGGGGRHGNGGSSSVGGNGGNGGNGGDNGSVPGGGGGGGRNNSAGSGAAGRVDIYVV